MSVFNFAFWSLVAFIAVLAFAIESGVASRHRRIVLSGISSSLIAVLMMMFVVKDDTKFDFGKPPVAKKKKGGPRGGLAWGTETEAGGSIRQPNAVAAAVRKADEDDDEEDYDGPDPKGFQDCPTCPVMVLIKGGQISIGSTMMEHGRGSGEEPIKDVKFQKAFAAGKYEVKVGEFKAFVEETGYNVRAVCPREVKRKMYNFNWQNPGFQQNDHHPVVCITWKDAFAYTRWLSAKTKRRYSLMSQGRWEYITRAMTISPYVTGMEITPQQANFANRVGGTTPVGSYKANPFELHDLHGNVWEMTSDCWSPDLSLVPEDGSPVGAVGDCSRHVIKGGAWDSKTDKLRSAARAVIGNYDAQLNVGFRLMLELPTKSKLLTLLTPEEGGTKERKANSPAPAAPVQTVTSAERRSSDPAPDDGKDADGAPAKGATAKAPDPGATPFKSRFQEKQGKQGK